MKVIRVSLIGVTLETTMFKIRTLKTPIIPPTNIIRSIFVNEMFLNAGNRVKNKRIELVSKPVK